MSEKPNLNNFTVNESGQIVKDGVVLPVREGIRATIKLAEIKKKKKKLPQTPRWKDSIFMPTDHATNELYKQTDHIAD